MPRKSKDPPRRRRSSSDRNPSRVHFARTLAPPELDDPKKRAKWLLPPLNRPYEVGQYLLELNGQHAEGIPGASSALFTLVDEALSSDKTPRSDALLPESDGAPISQRLLRITKSLFRCRFTDAEWRRLVAIDERRPVAERAIYRLWPDFPVEAQTDRSVATIKADAAFHSFGADGTGIVWAVIDSGIDARHPHFGALGSSALEDEHALLASAVKGLHRCFLENDALPSPDTDEAQRLESDVRAKLLEAHRVAALTDDFGHGTHVAGIISGMAPQRLADEKPVPVEILERKLEVDQRGERLQSAYGARTLSKQARLRGVAPACRLVSLRVLDSAGRGRASQVIQALEFIRHSINENPKLLRVHGVNLSVGYEFDAEMFACGQSPLCTAVNRLVQEGVVVVTAAGNTGYGSLAASARSTKATLSNTINDPGNAQHAITVGATHRDSPHLYGVSYFSSKGPTGDGRLKPDLVAPGERVTSCAAGQKLQTALASGAPEAGRAYYIDDSGTSMAAPHVSGAIAAFLSIRREFIGRPLDVKNVFLESATPLGRERYFEGHGLIDLMRAIQRV